MRLKLVDRTGVWFQTSRHDVSYWFPWARLPRSFRPELRWWGALRVRVR